MKKNLRTLITTGRDEIQAVTDGWKSAAPGPGSFLGLWSKVDPNNRQTMADHIIGNRCLLTRLEQFLIGLGYFSVITCPPTSAASAAVLDDSHHGI